MRPVTALGVIAHLQQQRIMFLNHLKSALGPSGPEVPMRSGSNFMDMYRSAAKSVPLPAYGKPFTLVC